MGLFDKLFQAKYCSICGEQIKMFENKKLKDGNCCKKCASNFSPFYKHKSHYTVEDTKYQLKCREENEKKLANFSPTKTINFGHKILVDEGKKQFAIQKSGKNNMTGLDIFEYSDYKGCSIKIPETKREMRYKDKEGIYQSFKPSFYACSYDFLLDIDVNVPYIRSVSLKLNSFRVDNNVETLLDMNSSVIERVEEKIASQRLFSGKNSNADEVKASEEYKKYERMLYGAQNAINEIFNPTPKPQKEETTAPQVQKTAPAKIKCPWCDVSSVDNGSGICPCCGGKLE